MQAQISDEPQVPGSPATRAEIEEIASVIDEDDNMGTRLVIDDRANIPTDGNPVAKLLRDSDLALIALDIPRLIARYGDRAWPNLDALPGDTWFKEESNEIKQSSENGGEDGSD